MKQFDLFECQNELDIQAKQEQMFQKWRLLPPERLILAGTPDRRRLGAELADGYCMVWEQALHRCQGLPPNREIWLNHIEKPEYWVMNWNDDPCGEHIEICPFCHANLACGEGDAVLIKADDGWWRILGFMEAGG